MLNCTVVSLLALRSCGCDRGIGYPTHMLPHQERKLAAYHTTTTAVVDEPYPEDTR
jgi:hypothetical protein